MASPLKSSFVAIACFILGLCIFLMGDQTNPFQTMWNTSASVAVVIGLIIGVSGFNDRKRSPTLFRLDHF